MSNCALAPDEAAIRYFISGVICDDIHLAAVIPDGPITGRFFGSDCDAAVDWAIEHNQQGKNLYWTANRCHAGVGYKPSKSDIKKIRFAHVDIDPPKDGSDFCKVVAIQRLEALSAPPTIIVDSGNGVQALWKLEEETEDREKAEGVNQGIARKFAGDSSHNIDRLLRLPGTVNYPNSKKRKLGRLPILSSLQSWDKERLVPLNKLERDFQVHVQPTGSARLQLVAVPPITLLKSSDLVRGDTAKLAMMINLPSNHFRNNDRSSWAYGIACQMIDDGYADGEVLGVLLNPANVGCAHIKDQSDPMRAAKRALSKARARFIPVNGSIFGKSPVSNTNLPTIEFVGGNLPQAVDQAEQALIEANLGYFQMGGRIVRTGTIPSLQVGCKTEAQWRIIEVSDAELIEAFTTVALWKKPGRNGDVTINCPPLVAETYQARRGKWALPSLAAVIDVPTIRPDGSILEDPGYDKSTGLLLQPGGTQVPSVSRMPTKADALLALDALKAPLRGFPFVSDADRSVAISALLTAVSRTALASAPLHGISAPTAGSGKSTIIDLASILRSGRRASTIAQGKTSEETEKRLGSMLLEGEGFVAIDNCESPLGGDFLCQALTQSTLKVRPLGKSTVVDVPAIAMMTATGNNLTFVGDMSRRALLCQLDPGVERPELRSFSFDPVKLVLSQRGDLVAAALTVLRAYHVAGRPDQVPPLGSFADWSNTVRSALIWLGCADPCDTMEKVRKADPQMALVKQVMAQWKRAVGSTRMTTGDLQAKAEEMVEQGIASTTKKHKYPELRDALLAVAGEAGRINGRKLGIWLSKQNGRVVNGRRFLNCGTRGGQSLWSLEALVAQSRGTPPLGD